MHQIMSKGRWKQMRGRIHKVWGKLTRNPCAEFLGEQDIMEGKLEEYYASRNGDIRGAHQSARPDYRYAGRGHGDLVA
jgi:uncharacterized protein YjbJ (UPF0337 family)